MNALPPHIDSEPVLANSGDASGQRPIAEHIDLKRLQLKPHKLFHHLDRLTQWRDGKDFAPLFVELSPIDICNQKCHFCYTDYLGHQKHLSIPPDLLIKIFRDMGDAGVRSVMVQGTGEPLLNKGTPEAIVAGKQHGLDIALCTNGVLFTDEILERVMPALSWMRVSAIEANAELYAKSHVCPDHHFARVVKNLKKAVEIRNRDKLEVIIACHFLPFDYNIDHLVDAVKMCKEEIGIDYALIKTPNMGLHIPEKRWSSDLFFRARDVMEKVAKLQDDNFLVSVRWDQADMLQDQAPFKKGYSNCQGMLFETMIDANAKVYPCLNFWRDDKYCLGDLTQASFGELWASDHRKQTMQQLWETYDLEKCHFGCKQHHINESLWDLMHPPMHVSFP